MNIDHLVRRVQVRVPPTETRFVIANTASMYFTSLSGLLYYYPVRSYSVILPSPYRYFNGCGVHTEIKKKWSKIFVGEK